MRSYERNPCPIVDGSNPVLLPADPLGRDCDCPPHCFLVCLTLSAAARQGQPPWTTIAGHELRPRSAPLDRERPLVAANPVRRRQLAGRHANRHDLWRPVRSTAALGAAL